MTGWRACVFGDFRLLRGSRQVGQFIPTRTPDRILAYAILVGRPIPRDEVLREFRPSEGNPERAGRWLNEHLHQLRRRLVDEWGVPRQVAREFIRVRNGSLVVWPSLDTDLAEFRRLAERAQVGNGGREDAATRAIALQQQPLLPGMIGGWVSTARAAVAETAAALEPILVGVTLEAATYGAMDWVEPGSVADVWVERDAERLVETLRLAEPMLNTRDRASALATLDGISDEVDESLKRAMESGDITLALRLTSYAWKYWHARSRSDALPIMREVLTSYHGHTTDTVARCRHGAGTLAALAGDIKAARRYLTAALAHWKEQRSLGEIARAQGSLAIVEYRAGNVPAARQQIADCIHILRALGLTSRLAWRLSLAGVIEIFAGDDEAALPLLVESLQLAEQTGNVRVAATTSQHLAGITLRARDTQAARMHYTTALQVSSLVGDVSAAAQATMGLGAACHVEALHFGGTFEDGHAYYEDAIALARRSGEMGLVGEVLRLQADLALDEGADGRALELCRRSIALLEAEGDADRLARSRRLLGKILPGEQAEGGQPKEGPSALG